MEKGNINLEDRPIIKNSDGSFSTVRSISINEDGKEVLIPTVRKGLSRVMSNQEAVDYYKKTGEYLGKFNSVKEADDYAEKLHNNQQNKYMPLFNKQNILKKAVNKNIAKEGMFKPIFSTPDTSISMSTPSMLNN